MRSLCLTLLLFSSSLLSAEKIESKRRVMTWVPPYAIEACEIRLDSSANAHNFKDGLTHLALQFWQPTKLGELKTVSRFQKIDDAKITEFQKWGQKHGVRVMLCIYNATNTGWDWELARSAFETHREDFIDALVKEVLRLKLDGVDIDFEGKGNQEASKKAFVQFIKDLSIRLHAEGKELTVNTFAYKWNAPNQTWWKELLPHIDALQVMGYAETGANATEWRSYKFLKEAAGTQASKLVIGMPSNVAEWQNKSAIQHIEWIVKDGLVGLAFWDAQLKSSSWRTPEIWKVITKLKSSPKEK
jgi:GH18 family chitinase